MTALVIIRQLCFIANQHQALWVHCAAQCRRSIPSQCAQSTPNVYRHRYRSVAQSMSTWTALSLPVSFFLQLKGKWLQKKVTKEKADKGQMDRERCSKQTKIRQGVKTAAAIDNFKWCGSWNAETNKDSIADKERERERQVEREKKWRDAAKLLWERWVWPDQTSAPSISSRQCLI